MKPQIPSFRFQRMRSAAAPASLCAALVLAACASNDGDETQLTAGFAPATPGGTASVEPGAAGDPGLEEEPTIGTARAALFGSDACKDVFITIYNQLAWPINVTRVEYNNQSEGRWQTEDLSNTVVWPGDHELWTENLEYSENDSIEDFIVHYEDYYGSHTSRNQESVVTCLANRSFVLHVQ